MTLYIPDISHHQGDISIQALKSQGAAALIARVGQGAGRRSNGQTYGTTQDRKWTRNHAEARRVGLPPVPYWYIGNLISADENARLAEAWVGDKSLPWMLDHEDASGSIAFYHQVRVAFARRGLRVILGYVPHWYWEGAGRRAPLTPGPPLVASRYSTASGSPSTIYAAAGGDRGQGWASYGGQDVALWQFTNKASMAGQAIDCSAFRGNVAQLAALLGGQEEDDMIDPNQTWWASTYTKSGTLGSYFRELRESEIRIEAMLAADKGVDVDALAAAVVAKQGDLLAEVIREVVPDEIADDIVTRLGEKLTALTEGN